MLLGPIRSLQHLCYHMMPARRRIRAGWQFPKIEAPILDGTMDNNDSPLALLWNLHQLWIESPV